MPKTCQPSWLSLRIPLVIVGLMVVSVSMLEAQQAASQAGTRLPTQEQGKQFRLESKSVRGTNGLPECVAEIWSVKHDRLLHRFTIPGVGHQFVFSPDQSTLISTDDKGNLGTSTTIRAFDLVSGEQRLLGTGPGDDGVKLVFAANGKYLAAYGSVGFFSRHAVMEQEGKFCLARIRVWDITKEGKSIDLDFCPPDSEVNFFNEVPQGPDQIKNFHQRSARVTPMDFFFSPTGNSAVSETSGGLLTLHDLQSGKTLPTTHTCSVSAWTVSMLLTLQAIPADITQFRLTYQNYGNALEGRPQAGVIEVVLQKDGFWQMTRNEKSFGLPFKISEGSYVLKEVSGERKFAILPLLGLEKDTSLSDLNSIRHPLGVINIRTRMQSIEFELQHEAPDTQKLETLKRGVVTWGK